MPGPPHSFVNFSPEFRMNLIRQCRIVITNRQMNRPSRMRPRPAPSWSPGSMYSFSILHDHRLPTNDRRRTERAQNAETRVRESFEWDDLVAIYRPSAQSISATHRRGVELREFWESITWLEGSRDKSLTRSSPRPSRTPHTPCGTKTSRASARIRLHPPGRQA
eukprot:SAG11_NODE_4380_length_1924_cov_1.736986_1_plen_164_part_00